VRPVTTLQSPGGYPRLESRKQMAGLVRAPIGGDAEGRRTCISPKRILLHTHCDPLPVQIECFLGCWYVTLFTLSSNVERSRTLSHSFWSCVAWVLLVRSPALAGEQPFVESSAQGCRRTAAPPGPGALHDEASNTRDVSAKLVCAGKR